MLLQRQREVPKKLILRRHALDIDRVLYKPSGFPMGPFAMTSDRAGHQLD